MSENLQPVINWWITCHKMPPDWGEYWTRLKDGTLVKQHWAWEGWTDLRSDKDTEWAEAVLIKTI